MVQKVRAVFLRKWGMLVLDAFTGHLTPDINPQEAVDRGPCFDPS